MKQHSLEFKLQSLNNQKEKINKKIKTARTIAHVKEHHLYHVNEQIKDISNKIKDCKLKKYGLKLKDKIQFKDDTDTGPGIITAFEFIGDEIKLVMYVESKNTGYFVNIKDVKKIK